MALRRLVYSTLFRLTYGIDVDRDDDVIISLFSEALERLVSEGAPGACPVDLFPLRKLRLLCSCAVVAHFKCSQICTIMDSRSRIPEAH